MEQQSGIVVVTDENAILPYDLLWPRKSDPRFKFGLKTIYIKRGYEHRLRLVTNLGTERDSDLTYWPMTGLRRTMKYSAKVIEALVRDIEHSYRLEVVHILSGLCTVHGKTQPLVSIGIDWNID